MKKLICRLLGHKKPTLSGSYLKCLRCKREDISKTIYKRLGRELIKTEWTDGDIIYSRVPDVLVIPEEMLNPVSEIKKYGK